jgi:hypothetical protein
VSTLSYNHARPSLVPSRGISAHSTGRSAILLPDGEVCVTHVTALRSHTELSHRSARQICGEIDFLSSARSPNQFAVMTKVNRQAEAAKKKSSAKQKEAAVQRAVELYKTLASSGTAEKPLGYRTVCKMVEDELEKETGNRIALCYNTVCKRLNGKLRQLLDTTEY